ncbi:MAG: phenylalanine--tRNA ligase subunit beta [Ruminococcaceae bacterium]|nr:phenylalanine--tRNA ligase subunit beta [Oscillospiraceae bacterium]
MLVSMNWIKEYVDLAGEDLEKLIMKFTLSTAEVEDIYFKGKEVNNVVVGEIVSFEAHPNSKKLHILKVDGGDRIYDCVCGAPNAALGLKVAFAKVGGSVPGLEIAKREVAGYVSEGMCCSEAELGISDENSGIMELDPSFKNGTDIKEIFDIDDVVFEVDNKSLTNRPDLWGHYGIAREFAALTKKPLKPLALTEPVYDGDNKIPVEVARKDLVYRYSCVQISDIKESVSPVNMRIRLYYCGMRGINLLADLTNYIMLELGQPTHAFDARKIDKIKVGTPDSAMKFTTLDNTERDVDTDTLLIYNNDTPVAIAGIMGGLDSEIIDGTTSVVLESANFDGVSVRKSSSRLGLRTDASMRYEKILDPCITITAIKRFVNLLFAIDPQAKVSSQITDEYVQKYPEIQLSFDKAYVDRYTGIDIPDEQILSTLNLLGFNASLNGQEFSVTVPSWRSTKDVTIKADVIEEITRIYGYDNFEITTTKSALTPVRATTLHRDSDWVKDILVQRYMMNEVHSYIWCDGAKYKKLGIDVEENVTILNIATPENGTIRNSMIPTLLTFAYENKQYAPSYGLFEIGRVVDGVTAENTCNERRRLGVVLYDKNCGEKALYFKAVEIIRYICGQLRHSEPSFTRISPVHNWQHPKNTSEISLGGVNVGTLCTLHPSTLKKIDKNASVVCIEIDMDDFETAKINPLGFNEPSKFPGVDYDLSLVTNGKKYEEISAAWEKEKISELDAVKLVDTYELDGELSITLRFSFSSDERTLSMDEIQQHIDKIISNLTGIGVTPRV